MTSAADIQALIDAAPNGGTVRLPFGQIDGVLNLANRTNLTLIGEGKAATYLNGPTSAQCVIDMTGAENCILERFTLKGYGSNAGLLIARSAQRGGGANNTFRDIHLAGEFAVAGIYNYGGESNEFYGVKAFVERDYCWAYYHTATNSHGLSSPNTQMVSGGQSAGNVSFFGGALNNYSPTNGTCEAVLIDGGGGIRFYGTYFAAAGQRVVRLRNALQNILLSGCIFEPTNTGWPVSSIEHLGGAGGNMSALEIENCSLFAGGGFAGLRGVDGVNFPSLRISASGCNQPLLLDIYETMGADIQLGGTGRAKFRHLLGGSVIKGGANEFALDLPTTVLNSLHLPWQGQARTWGI